MESQGCQLLTVVLVLKSPAEKWLRDDKDAFEWEAGSSLSPEASEIRTFGRLAIAVANIGPYKLHGGTK